MKNRTACRIFLTALSLISAVTLFAADSLSPAQENAVIQKYCGSCHTDALMYGGLSVQHFDAVHPDPTLAAMLLSKVTKGHTPKEVAVADSPEILNMMKESAMGAAGIGVPDESTQVALSRTLASQADGAYAWNARWDGVATDRTLTASIIRETPTVKPEPEGVTDSYRLMVSCRANTRSGEIKLAWANGAPREGTTMSVAVDAAPAVQHKVEGGRAQGNGSGGPGATILKIPLPSQNLTISNLFSATAVVFPVDELAPTTRRELAACFAGGEAAY